MTEKTNAKPKKAAGKARVKAGTSRQSAELRRKAFVEAYIRNGCNATAAAVEAGYSEMTADQQGSRLLKDIKVRQLIEDRRKVLESRTELTTERVLRELGRIALFDPRRLFGDDGSPKGIHELDDDTAAGIAGLEVLEQYEGTGESRVFVGHLKKYRIVDKNSALEKAMKFLGMFEKDNKQRAGLLGELSRNEIEAIRDRLAGLAKRRG
ncbi:terminase small subunit [Azoarcus indigens]|uniref:Terminase small subunit n=1 Tax=Azoarcus indigens TaxID=29545 RepID=A0A4R6DWL8_9RHOO|nr:terminase small subunit [Azoarcus indigens]NMG64362.1 terminase small subunit [Azoarcus indigens]TDN49184.1 terminase small subunit [Azoarcus indigens]